MKKIAIMAMLLTGMALHAQEQVAPTDQLTIEGKVDKPFVFTLKDATNYQVRTIDSLVIYNHLHERKRVVKNIRGVLLKDILQK